MHSARQLALADTPQMWFETAPRNGGREHRDGVLRGLAFLAAMLGVFLIFTATGGPGGTDHDTKNARPVATYATVALGRG